MKSLLHRSVWIALRVMIAGALCLGIWNSWHFARADYLGQQDSEESIRSAIRLEPDGWEYYLRLSQFDRADSRGLLETSLSLYRYNAQADIELALRDEGKEDFPNAERLLLDAYAIDHTWPPRWALANYYFRRDDMPKFWIWARRAAEMPTDDMGALFELCWRVSPDPERISAAILNEKPEMIRQYIGFLLAKDQLQAVAYVAPHLVNSGDPDTDLPLMFSVVNRLVASSDGDSANALWHQLIRQHWVEADNTLPNNAGFARKPLPVSFDWSIAAYPGLRSLSGPLGLETEFTGTQPEECSVAEQAVALKPGNYSMNYAYQTSDIAPDTGLEWQIVDAKSNTVVAHSSDLSSDEMKNSAMGFSVPPGSSMVLLRLAYRRVLGTPRISGTLTVRSIQIQALRPS
jgi:hypothetical protein